MSLGSQSHRPVWSLSQPSLLCTFQWNFTVNTYSHPISFFHLNASTSYHVPLFSSALISSKTCFHSKIAKPSCMSFGISTLNRLVGKALIVGDSLWYETCLAIRCLVQILAPFLKAIGTFRSSLEVLSALELSKERDLATIITNGRDLGVGIPISSKVHTLRSDVWLSCRRLIFHTLIFLPPWVDKKFDARLFK